VKKILNPKARKSDQVKIGTQGVTYLALGSGEHPLKGGETKKLSGGEKLLQPTPELRSPILRKEGNWRGKERQGLAYHEQIIWVRR